MAVFDVVFYDQAPNGIFSQTVGGTTTFTGSATPEGNATITDNQTGTEGTTLDDYHASETATADVSVGGLTSTGSPVDGVAAWTLRDTVTGEIFDIVEFDVENGGAAGAYLLSERPLVPGRSYETLTYDSLPDATQGDPAFTYIQQTGFGSDQIVSGTSGDDVIDTSYTGDPDGDLIDNLDHITTTPSTDEILSWSAFGAVGTDLSGNNTQTVGGVSVGIKVSDEDNFYGAQVATNDQYVGADAYNTTSSIQLGGTGNSGAGIEDTSTVTIDFSAEQNSGKASSVADVNFRINDIDFAGWQDIVTITAIGPDGSLSPVTITVDGNDSLVGNTVTGETTSEDAINQAGSIKVDIEGPVRQIIIDYDNGGTGGQLISLTDVHFTTLSEAGDNDDSLNTAAGNDYIDSGLGSDTVNAGADNDTIVAGSGDDILSGASDQDTFLLDDDFGTDVIVGGEGGVDNDVLDASSLTSAVNVNFTEDETGSLTDGTSTANFFEIEDFVLTDLDDTFDGSASTAPIEVSAGAGNDSIVTSDSADRIDGGLGSDTLEGGGGSDTLTGGLGNDTFVYTATGGMDVITDFGAGNTGSIYDGDQTNNDLVDLSSFYTPAALAAYNAANGALGDLAHEITLLREDAADGTLDGNVNGIDISGTTGTINLTLENGGNPVTGNELSFDNTNVICFAKGTLIKTAAGDRRVEDLKPGDYIFTQDNGLQNLRWVGSRTIDANGKFAPIVISAGVLANKRDLRVSPQHRMLVTGDKAERMFGEREVLVPAKHLTNWPGIYIEMGDEITYFHLLFEAHEIVFAEGAPSESFHPGEIGMSTLEDAAREEIYALFPELRQNLMAFGPAARKSLRASEARLLEPAPLD